MCGLAGLIHLDGAPAGPEDERVVESMCDLMAYRGPDDRGVRSIGRRLPRVAAARDHRPLACRPHADERSDRALVDCVQRRSLQLCGRSRGAGTHRRPVPFAQRHRSPAASLDHLGLDLPGQVRRHVRVRALRPAGKGTRSRARPLRRQAALLDGGGRPDPVRLRDQGAHGASAAAIQSTIEVSAGGGSTGMSTPCRSRP